jgi:stage V sporulation protein G
MNISKVSITMNNSRNSRLVAFASIIIDDCIVIKDIKIVKGKYRLFVSMPSKKVNDNFVEYVHPINQQAREYVESAIFEEYNYMVENAKINAAHI